METGTDTCQVDYFSRLPNEVIVKIFRLLQDSNYCLGYVVPLVCRRWRTISKDPHLWTYLALNNYKMCSSQLLPVVRSKPHLKTLKLEGVANEETYLSVFRLCRNLECLKLANHTCAPCDLSSYTLSRISSKSVRHVSFDWLNITDEEVLILCQQLPSLTSLEIRRCNNISYVSFDYIACFLDGLQVLLTEIYHHDHNLERSINNVLQKHNKHLVQLEICCSNLTEDAFLGIEQCKHLVKLSFRRCNVTDGLLLLIAQLPHLAYLKLHGARDNDGRATESGWNGFLDRRSCSLRALDLQQCEGITDRVLETLAVKSPQLNFLSLYKVEAVTDKGLQSVINCCPNIQTLVLQFLFKITTNSLVQIPSRMTWLKGLYVYYCQFIGDGERQQLSTLGVPILDRWQPIEDAFGNLVCRHFISDNLFHIFKRC